MKRRSFLGAAAGLAVLSDPAQAAQTPIIDCHIHLFDTTRKQGVPWPAKTDTVLYRPAMPDRFRELATPLGVSGAIEVEASPWLEDNQWVLDLAATNPIIVGTIGSLEPGKPDFAANLDRFHRNPLFLGIRYGNLWGRSLADDVLKPQFISDIKLLSRAGLTLDSANPNPALIRAIVQLTDKVPDLRVVIDHLPQMQMPAEADTQKTYRSDLREIGRRPQIYVKISEVLRRVDGYISTDVGFYRNTLDELFGVFGADRVLYGSDWPNSDLWKPYPEVLGIVREYFKSKGRATEEKYFWKNSVNAYRWKPRTKSQPA